MPLMKEKKLGNIVHEAIVLDLGDLRRQANEIIAKAHAKADVIVNQSRAEAKKLTESAEDIGHAQGLEAGTAQGLEEGRAAGHAEALADMTEQLDQLQQSWANAAEQVEALRRQLRLDARQDVLELALAIADKVVKRIPQVQPETVIDQLAAALEHVTRPSDLMVRINPTDRPLVEQALPRLTEQFEQMQHVKLLDDESVTAGGCIVSYGRGLIDATLDQQLDRIVQTLLPNHAVGNATATENSQ